MRSTRDSLKPSRDLLTGLFDDGRSRSSDDPCWAHPGLAAARDDGFLVFERIATGGESDVWIGGESNTQDIVVIKVAARDEGSGANDDEGLAHEARMLEGLRSPNIVGVRGFGGSAGRRYLVLDFIEGFRLDEVVADGTPVPIERLVRSLVHAVATLHEAGVVHGDLKPTNVMVSDGGEPTLIDFGLARKSNEVHGVLPELAARLRAGGTYGYLAPELRTDTARRPPTMRSDVFSLATILAELIAAYPSLGRWRKAIQPGLLANPGQRFAHAGALLQALHAADATRAKWRVRVAVGVAITAVVAGLIGGRHLADRSAQRAALSPDLTSLYRDVVTGLPEQDPATLLERLNRVPESERAWPWRFLRARAEAVGIENPFAHLAQPNPATTAMAATADATAVAWCEQIGDGFVVQYQQLEGRPRSMFRFKERPRGLSFSPDAAWLVMQLSDRTVRLVNVHDPARQVATPEHVPVRGVGFDIGGHYRFREVETGRLYRLSLIDGATSLVADEAVAEARPLLVEGRTEGFFSVRKDAAGRRVGVLETADETWRIDDLKLQDRIVSAAFLAPTLGRLYLGTSTGEIFVFEPNRSASLRPVWRDPGASNLTALTYAPSQRLLFGVSNSVRVIDAESGEEVVQLPFTGPRDVIKQLSWNEAAASLTLIGSRSIQVWTAPRDLK
ncbi:MAG: protein kinase [Planctomycetota bacterium]